MCACDSEGELDLVNFALDPIPLECHLHKPVYRWSVR